MQDSLAYIASSTISSVLLPIVFVHNNIAVWSVLILHLFVLTFAHVSALRVVTRPAAAAA